MNRHGMRLLPSASALLPLLAALCAAPPSEEDEFYSHPPLSIDGPEAGRTDSTYQFTIWTDRGEESRVDWGDGKTTGWLLFRAVPDSGQTSDSISTRYLKVSHAWSEPGSCTVKLRLRDEVRQSEWLELFRIEVVSAR